VTVIGGASNEVLRTIAVDSGPIDFCYNPVQNRVYVANYFGATISVLRDSGGGVEEGQQPIGNRQEPMATVVRRVLHLLSSPYPLPAGEGQGVRELSWLLDATGRKVMELQAGPNDVRHLAPVIYFVRRPSAASGERSAVHKVVITR